MWTDFPSALDRNLASPETSPSIERSCSLEGGLSQRYLLSGARSVTWKEDLRFVNEIVLDLANADGLILLFDALLLDLWLLLRPRLESKHVRLSNVFVSRSFSALFALVVFASA